MVYHEHYYLLFAVVVRFGFVARVHVGLDFLFCIAQIPAATPKDLWKRNVQTRQL